ncbi:hypothetical protein [Enterococcus durans]|uniref:hypothetical protein n=1 Tax=Enterococcus durans TaxID=53345 RepID=UPI0014321FD3|nr:hypothetical protein [Enterococcus durans]
MYETKEAKQKAIGILSNHLDMLASIPTEVTMDNPVILAVVSESIKNCSLALVLVTKL